MSSGVNVYDTSGVYLGLVFLANTSAVWADDTYMYIGTTNSGIYITLASGVLSNPVVHYKYDADITSNNVLYLHGGGDYLCAATYSGVDQYNVVSGTRIYTTQVGGSKCYQTAAGAFYYTPMLFPVENRLDLLEWGYYRRIGISSPQTTEFHVTLQLDSSFTFNHCNANGGDVRFVLQNGQDLPYYIESWTATSAEILIKLPADTTFFYMVYGNSNATSESTTDTFWFYDDFEGSNIDPTVWYFDPGSGGTYTVHDSYVDINAANNTLAKIVSNNPVEWGYLRVMLRAEYFSSGDWDGTAGYAARSVYFGMAYPSTDEGPNIFRGGIYGADVVGTEFMAGTWRVWECKISANYQASVYGSDNLETYYTMPATGSSILSFGNQATASRPNFWIDWIKVTSWPLDDVVPGQENVIYSAALHAVYDTNSNWTDPSYSYNQQTLLYLANVNDIYVTEGTSLYNSDNVIFLATANGIQVIEERKGDEENSRVKRYYLK